MNDLRRRALFLDRDGVINIDYGYVHRQESFEFVDGIFDLGRAATQLGYLIVVITNQAGIGRGYYTENDFLSLMDWVREKFRTHGSDIAAVYFCPDHPVHGIGKYKRDSPFRKPAPGMILQAARELNIDLAASVLVGDMETDIAAGCSAGIGTLLLLQSDNRTPDTNVVVAGAILIPNVLEARDYLVAC
jgi:D-glycero-D-manno-heptose 1,7-bisphosphate phosphatase